MSLLEDIHEVEDIKTLDLDQLKILAYDIRKDIIDVVSKNGGHLSSSLGTVELTLSLHYVFNSPKDKIIWDVGHQSYAHKLLTGRKDTFKTLRTFEGISGFPKNSESPHDCYNTGHSSTSLSLALGEAISRDLHKNNNKVIAVIGDGSLTAGMAFEALNQIGHLKKDVIIILNDNEHSIDKNVGALSEYLLRVITGSMYNKLRKKSYDFIRKIPRYGIKIFNLFDKIEARIKGIFLPGSFFEDLGIRYFGPVDGHNIHMLVEMMQRISQINVGPKIIHVYTKKGKGYEPAEKKPAIFHGTGPFNIKTGKQLSKNTNLNFSSIAGKTLAAIARKDKKIIGITAAMKLGTGLHEFEKIAPERFFDVGICEQHAITMAASIAKNGFKPFVSIYSTFLQRAYDQLVHDVGIMNLPVKLLIDRAGIVGDDGETHHGLLDISLIRTIPNFVLLAPTNGIELRDMLYFAASYDKGPIAIRYPRGEALSSEIRLSQFNKFNYPSIHTLITGNDIAIFAVGDMTKVAIDVNNLLRKQDFTATVVSLLSLKPLDSIAINQIIDTHKYFITLENAYIGGGIGEYLNTRVENKNLHKLLFNGGFPDRFIPHGKPDQLFALNQLDAESLTGIIINNINQRSFDEQKNTPRRIPRRA
ncbi:MAG: 1-deoxy-D-xylulose-5-phosphate synthase [bacterium]